MWPKFRKLLFFAATAVYTATACVVILVLRHKEWHENLARFMRRTFSVFVVQEVGSTGRGFINSILVSILALLILAILIGYLNGFKAMREHIAENAAMSIAGLVTVLLLVYGTQFAWEVAKVGYKDHQDLVATIHTSQEQVAGLKQQKGELVDPTSRDQEISTLKQSLAALKQQGSRETKFLLLSRFSKPGVREMEYIGLTDKIRSPVEISSKCDFPISDMHVSPLTTSGGSVLILNKQVFPSKARLTMESPPWTPAQPLLVTVFLGGTVDRTPTCSLEVKQ